MLESPSTVKREWERRVGTLAMNFKSLFVPFANKLDYPNGRYVYQVSGKSICQSNNRNRFGTVNQISMGTSKRSVESSYFIYYSSAKQNNSIVKNYSNRVKSYCIMLSKLCGLDCWLDVLARTGRASLSHKVNAISMEHVTSTRFQILTIVVLPPQAVTPLTHRLQVQQLWAVEVYETPTG